MIDPLSLSLSTGIMSSIELDYILEYPPLEQGDRWVTIAGQPVLVDADGTPKSPIPEYLRESKPAPAPSPESHRMDVRKVGLSELRTTDWDEYNRRVTDIIHNPKVFVDKPYNELTAHERWAVDLHSTEVAAIQTWETSFEHVTAMREFTRTGVVPTNAPPRFEKWAESFKSGIDRAPNYNGQVFRGLVNVPVDLFKEGEDVTIDAYSSASEDEKIARHFLRKSSPSGERVMLVIKSSTGAELGRASSEMHDIQKEVIIRPGTRFKVVSVTRQNFGKKPYKLVQVEEV